jgi:glutamine synthetase
MRDFGAKKPIKKLYGTLHDALGGYRSSKFLQEIMGTQTHEKYFEIKKSVMERAPKELGTTVKTGEVIFHHEVTNQILWNRF